MLARGGPCAGVCPAERQHISGLLGVACLFLPKLVLYCYCRVRAKHARGEISLLKTAFPLPFFGNNVLSGGHHMAKFLSTVYSTIRGSVGGLTYTANQFGALIVRARTSPVNPNSVNQSAMRSAFSGAQTLWENISEPYRQGWNDYAATLVYTGPLGPYTVPGRQVFMGVIGTAIYLEARGLPVGAVTGIPPTIPGFLNLGTVEPGLFAGIDAVGISVQVTYEGAEDIVFFTKRSRAFNATRNSFKGPFNSSTLIGGEITPPATTLASFDGLTEDLRYFTLTRGITAAEPYRLSAEYFLQHTAIDTTA